jgi:hypothetical protein
LGVQRITLAQNIVKENGLVCNPEGMPDLSPPDVSQPGSDGALPEGFKEWQWGVVYTVRGEMRAPLVRGQEYSTMAMARRRIPRDQPFTAYAGLYQRAAAIVAARAADWARSGSDLRTWIAGQSWGSFGEALPFAYASIGIGLLLPHEGQAVPASLIAPSPVELLEAAVPPAPVSPPQPGEVYNDFDFRDPSQPLTSICLFSFGEMVPSHCGLTFESFVERAEVLARRHRDLLNPEATGEPQRARTSRWCMSTFRPKGYGSTIHTDMAQSYI